MALIAVIDLYGNINARRADMMSPVLDMLERSRRVAGVLLRVNSPGGEVTASEILYRKIKSVRDKKPVYVSVSSMCASGAYWASSVASKIFAMETSLVGSIGVIGVSPTFKRLLDKLGIDVTVNKIGKYKDMNNPFVEPTQEGKEKMEHIMNSAFLPFRNAVAIERKLSAANIEQLATGEVFSSDDAMKFGLIDAIGTYEDAIEALRKETGVRKVKIIAPKRPFISRFIGFALKDTVEEIMESVQL